MCGRYTLTKDSKDIMDYLKIENWDPSIIWERSYNIAPDQNALVLTFKSIPTIQSMYWGLIPSWSKDGKIGSKMINARMETLTTKPTFRKLLHSQRCIIISDGYYEWMQTRKEKRPYYIRDPENKILPLAGLWDVWKNRNDKIRMNYTIITTEPAESVQHIHKRMPAILPKEKLNSWIDCTIPQDKAMKLLKPYTQNLFFHPVSKFVNTPINNSQKCIQPMMIKERF